MGAASIPCLLIVDLRFTYPSRDTLFGYQFDGVGVCETCYAGATSRKTPWGVYATCPPRPEG